MPEEEKDEHNKLYSYVILFILGVILLVAGIQSLPGGWIAILLGGGLSAFAGFEVRFTYNKIQHEEGSIRAKQGGTGNVQTNVSNPNSSPIIQRADNVIINPSTRKSRNKTESTKQTLPERKPEEGAEWLCNGEIHFDKYQEFAARVSKGDRIEGHVKSEDPITVQIMSQKDFDILSRILDNEIDEDGEYNSYYSTPNTTAYDFSWTATVNRTVIVVVTGGIEYDDGEFTASVTARIRITRSKAT